MTKTEFLEKLERLLQDIPADEREEALRFYGEYFSDAGPFEEEAVLAELGSPERVAAAIRQGLGGAEHASADTGCKCGTSDETVGEIPLPIYARHGAGAPPKAEPSPAQYGGNAPRTDPASRRILLILLAVLLFPFWFSLLMAVLGIMLGVVGAGVGFLLGGIGAVIGSIVRMILSIGTFTVVGAGTSFLALGLMVLGVAGGILLAGLGVGILFWFIPACWHVFKKFVIDPLRGKRSICS